MANSEKGSNFAAKITLMNYRNLFTSLLSLTIFSIFSVSLYANDKKDSTDIKDIEEVVIISTPKETGKLSQLPNAVSIVSQNDMRRHGITSLKGMSDVVANLYIPDYGSRLTSAIYIRGIGSRINTPAVGLYVDNIPYFDKSAFDFNFYDIERIDVLRGPQGTLYGRNSMGGLIKVHTHSPFSYQGTSLNFGMATGDAHRHISLTHYHRISQHFAFSAGGYYDGSNGFFRNSQRHERQDKMNAGGGRLRAIYRANDRLKVDLSLNYDYSHEGGYPYFYSGKTKGEESHPELLNKITANEHSSYRRNMLNTGVNVEYKANCFTLNYITGFQHLQDRMFLDQDFIADDIYTLEQKQNLNIISQELTMKSHSGAFWEWLNGISASKQWLKTTGPVTFKEDGVKFLQNNINSYMPDLSAKGITSMGVTINDPQLLMSGRFQTPITNLAIFHQSTLNFTKTFSATIGVRLDHEHNSITYNSTGAINYDFNMTSGRMPLSLRNLSATPSFIGKTSHNYLEVLPKVALKWQASPTVMLYTSAAKGHRSGGYNVQMFSDLLQESMRNKMMQGIKDETNRTLDRYAQMGMPANVINSIKAGLDQMPIGQTPDVNKTVTFKPEFSWNYEVGTKIKLLGGSLNIDFATFFTTIRDQQIARFANSGLGRMMVNVGRSRSYGVETNMRYTPTRDLTIWGTYGYTHATFTKHDAGNGTNYRGNFVPFIPRHTICAGADYTFWKPQCSWLKSLTLGADVKANGRIYWTESNSASQSLYTTIGTHLLADLGKCEINLWGKNLTNKHYSSFYFESMNRKFIQKGKPIQVGIDISLKF